MTWFLQFKSVVSVKKAIFDWYSIFKLQKSCSNLIRLRAEEDKKRYEKELQAYKAKH